MDFRETAEQTMLRESVARIAADYGHDYFLAKAKAGEKTTELWQAVSRAGFVGVNLPAEHGGGGMGISELAIVTEELAGHGCPLLLLMVSPAICGTLLARFGTPGQRERWLPPIASGERKMVFAITEPDAGSNTHKLDTVATRDGDGWRISGRKYYISGVDEADAVLVVSRTGVEEGSGRGRLSLFIVDTDAPGLDRTLIELQVHAPERQFFLFLDDVRVDGDRLLGDEGDGLRQVFNGLNPERIIGAAAGNGIARYALAKAAAYANQRQVWGVPIGTHQGLAHPLAEAKIEAEAALHAVDVAIQVHGGNGFAAEYGIADLWWMARVLRTAPVSREMILNYVAEHS